MLTAKLSDQDSTLQVPDLQNDGLVKTPDPFFSFRTMADVFVNGQNVAEVMTGEGFGKKG